jgi:hypothetical protein
LLKSLRLPDVPFLKMSKVSYILLGARYNSLVATLGVSKPISLSDLYAHIQGQPEFGFETSANLVSHQQRLVASTVGGARDTSQTYL